MLRLLRRYPIWFIPSLAFTSGAEAADDTSVLCSWEFLVVMSAYDEACTLEQNLEMKRALAESISQLDAFIIRHSDLPNTAPLLAKKKDELRQRVFDDMMSTGRVDLTNAVMMKNSELQRTIGNSRRVIHPPSCVHG